MQLGEIDFNFGEFNDKVKEQVASLLPEIQIVY